MAFIFSAIVGYTAPKSWIAEERPQDKQETMKQMPTFTQENNREEYSLLEVKQWLQLLSYDRGYYRLHPAKKLPQYLPSLPKQPNDIGRNN